MGLRSRKSLPKDSIDVRVPCTYRNIAWTPVRSVCKARLDKCPRNIVREFNGDVCRRGAASTRENKVAY